MSDFDDLLRRTLDEEAARVEIAPDALGAIRERTAKRRFVAYRRSSTRRLGGGLMLTLSSAAAAVVVVAAVSIGSCTPSDPAHPPVAAGAGTSPGITAPASVPPAASAPGTVRVPIYYLGSVAGVPKLYREFHPVKIADQSTAALLGAAITQMLDGRTAADPDYSSQWPAGASVRGVTVSAGVATVDLSGATVNGYDPVGNRAALQQLIWTGTAYSGGTGVKLLFDGKPRATLWASRLPVAGVLHRAAAVDTLGPVWVIDPQTNATSGRQVTVNLAGIVWEGAIRLRVRDASGKPVTEQHVQLTTGAPAQGTATVHLTLAPGTYTVEAFYLAASSNSNAPLGLDGHKFIVH
jgi:hypothetical protein